MKPSYEKVKKAKAVAKKTTKRVAAASVTSKKKVTDEIVEDIKG